MTARTVTTVMLLAVVAIGSGFLATSLQGPEEEVRRTSTIRQGFYLRSARILGTDDQGRLLYEIEAEFAEQQANDEIAMQNVRITYSTGSDVPWTIVADTATIEGGQELLTLTGHVTATSNEGFAGQVTEIRTPHLTINPESYQAETDTRVQIRIGTRSLTATGMLALLQENKLQLKSNVSGKFVP